MTVFTPEDHAFFRDNGYVVAREVVPPENLRATVAMIWDFLGMDPANPEDWYRPPLSPGGMLEVYQHQVLWDNRQAPRVHQAFSEIFGTERLWSSFDRVNMKPPRHPRPPRVRPQGVHPLGHRLAQPDQAAGRPGRAGLDRHDRGHGRLPGRPRAVPEPRSLGQDTARRPQPPCPGPDGLRHHRHARPCRRPDHLELAVPARQRPQCLHPAPAGPIHLHVPRPP